MNLFPWQPDRLLIDFARELKLHLTKPSFLWYSHASTSDFNNGKQNALRDESRSYSNEWRVRDCTNGRGGELEWRQTFGKCYWTVCPLRKKNRLLGPLSLFSRIRQFIVSLSDRKKNFIRSVYIFAEFWRNCCFFWNRDSVNYLWIVEVYLEFVTSF